MDPATQSSDSEMQIPAYQNEGVIHLATTTRALAWCGEEHQQTTIAACERGTDQSWRALHTCILPAPIQSDILQTLVHGLHPTISITALA